MFYALGFSFWGVIGDEVACGDEFSTENIGASYQNSRDLLLFSGNDYLGLSSHPTIAKAAAKVCLMTVFLFFAYFIFKSILTCFLDILICPLNLGCPRTWNGPEGFGFSLRVYQLS